ncbi:hypothetical protein KI387_025840, partial [Taxus chinensis]
GLLSVLKMEMDFKGLVLLTMLFSSGLFISTLSQPEGFPSFNCGAFTNQTEERKSFMYRILEMQTTTHYGDVVAIHDIAMNINVPRDWSEADPCFPKAYGIICNQDNPPRVIVVNLTGLGLNGVLPPSIGNLTALTQLLLGNNNLRGSIPGLSSLKNLTILQLESNQLTGGIPTSLEDLPKLNQLFLQNNKLDATIPSGLIKLCQQGPAFCIIEPQKSSAIHNTKTLTIMGLLIGVLIGCSVLFIIIVAVFVLIMVWRHTRTSQPQITDGGPASLPQIHPSTGEDENKHFRPPIEYSEEEIISGTNNYADIIGRGGFGDVFKGALSGLVIAVKKISIISNQGQQQFKNELALLSRIHHRNLVKLVGYCRQPALLALVYEYMPGGTLKDHLSGKMQNRLDWHTRLNIALQTAEGLLYLHRDCSPTIIHRDIKSSNILLDVNLSAKLADFGLSRLLEFSKSHTSTVVKGTPGYIDPEYFQTGTLTEMSDVYSFGVVLLEIISAVSPQENIVQRARQLISSRKLDDLMDSCLEGTYNESSAWKVVDIACRCVEKEPKNRPKMRMVVEELETAVKLFTLVESNQSRQIS